MLVHPLCQPDNEDQLQNPATLNWSWRNHATLMHNTELTWWLWLIIQPRHGWIHNQLSKPLAGIIWGQQRAEQHSSPLLQKGFIFQKATLVFGFKILY